MTRISANPFRRKDYRTKAEERKLLLKVKENQIAEKNKKIKELERSLSQLQREKEMRLEMLANAKKLNSKQLRERVDLLERYNILC